MINLATLALAVLVFPGGDVGALARELARWSHRPVVALVMAERARPVMSGPSAEDAAEIWRTQHVKVEPIGPEWKPARRVKGFRLTLPGFDGGRDLVRLLRVQGRTDGWTDGRSIALWDPTWPVSATGEPTLLPLPEGWKEAEKGMVVKDARATIKLPPSQAATVDSLAKMGWSKPVKAHWFLGRMWVVPCIESSTEEDALRAIAAAVGGKLVEEPAGWRIDLDLSAIRARAIKAIDRVDPAEDARARMLDGTEALSSADVELARAKVLVCRQAWQSIDKASLTELFASPRASIYRKINRGTALHTAAGRFVATWKGWCLNPPKGRESTAGARTRLMQKIDWDGDPGILMGQNLGAAVCCPASGGGTVVVN